MVPFIIYEAKTAVALGIGLQARTVYVPSDKDSEKIVADPKVKMGTVDKLRDELRKAGVQKVFYEVSGGESAARRPMASASVDKKTGVKIYTPDDAAVKREDICVALLNSKDRMFFHNAPATDDASVFKEAQEFLKAHGERSRIMVRCDKNTSYGAFVHLHSLLESAFADAGLPVSIMEAEMTGK